MPREILRGPTHQPEEEKLLSIKFLKTFTTQLIKNYEFYENIIIYYYI